MASDPQLRKDIAKMSLEIAALKERNFKLESQPPKEVVKTVIKEVKVKDPSDEQKIDALSKEIDRLRSEIRKKPKAVIKEVKVPVEVIREVEVPVEVKVPFEVVREVEVIREIEVPVEVIKEVKVPVDVEVIKEVQVPMEVKVPVVKYVKCPKQASMIKELQAKLRGD